MKNLQELNLEEQVRLNGGVHDQDGKGCIIPVIIIKIPGGSDIPIFS